MKEAIDCIYTLVIGMSIKNQPCLTHKDTQALLLIVPTSLIFIIVDTKFPIAQFCFALASKRMPS